MDRCPRKVYAACCSLNDARSRTYERLSASSKKSQKAVYRSMTHAYINILVIAVIEIAFYFLLLTIPTYYMINNVKFLDEIIITGAKRIANREGSDSNPSAVYDRFLRLLDFNTYLLILLIDFLIILIVPNAVNVELWYYAVVVAVAALVILSMYIKKYRQNKLERQAMEADDQDDTH